MKIDGFDELLNRIKELGNKGNRIANKALREGAEPILKDMKLMVPVDTGKGRESLKIGNVRTRKDNKVIPIGLTKDVIGDAYWLRFHEYGTSKMQARPFLEPAYEKNKNISKNIIIKNMKEGLGIK